MKRGQPLLTLAVIMMLAATATGCSGARGTGTADQTTASVTPREAIERFDPHDAHASFARLNTVTDQGPAVIPDVAGYLADASPTRRFAALYVVAQVANAEKDAALLRSFLSDSALANRVIAAGSMASLGDAQVLPVLIAGLAAGEVTLPFSDPPESVAEFAKETLEAYTGRSFSASAGWKQWWDKAKGSIRWDGQRYVTL